jgi:hypothetical protein
MTLPDERYRAISNARSFLRSLLDPKATPRVPKEVRTQAYYVLKHFPWESHMEQLAEKCPGVIEKPRKRDYE